MSTVSGIQHKSREGAYPLNQLLVHKLPPLVDLQEPRKACQAVGQGIPCGVQGEVAQFGQAAVGNEDVGERRIADAALQLEDGHFADGIFVTGQPPDKVGDVGVFHGN